MAEDDMPQDPLDMAGMGAIAMKNTFDNLVAAGFTEDQALKLIALQAVALYREEDDGN